MARRSRNNSLGLQISSSLLARLCQKYTELQLRCIPQASKVAFYSVGSVPHLRLTLVGAAERTRETNEVKWRGSNDTDSDVCGKTWKDLSDSSTDNLDAWSSCLRNQMTYTSSGSKNNFLRLVEKTRGKLADDHFHLEPVLMRKTDLWNNMPPSSVYPRDRDGKPLWLNTDYIAVALLRIDLAPGSSPFNSDYWKITKEFTDALTIQLLHLHLKNSLSRKIDVIKEERDEIKKILIRQIRNILTKLNLVYRVIDNEAAHLRQMWENIIHECHPGQPCRANIVEQLNLLLQELDIEHKVVAESETLKQLVWSHNKLAEHCFLPEENEVWFQQKILPLWKIAASRFNSAPKTKKQVKDLLDQLQKSFYVGLNETLIDKIDNIPRSAKSKWKGLAYNEKDWTRVDLLKKYIHLLESIDIELPNKRKTLENLLCLRNLVLYFEGLENKLNNYIDEYKIHATEEQIYLH